MDKALVYTGGPALPPKIWLAARPSATMSCMAGGVVGRDLLALTSLDLDRHPVVPCGIQHEADPRGWRLR